MSVVLLGPQRHNPTIGRVLADKGWGGPYALITAGWQEREPEDDELRAAIGGESVNLELNAHYNALMAEDPELGVQTRHRQTRLRELQEVYRVRLASGMQAARRLLARDGEPWLMDRERESSIEAVRQLDRHHLSRIREIFAAFDEEMKPRDRDAVRRRRATMMQQIADAQCVLIAGGHVAVLLNRLRMFDLAPGLREKPVVAWSAGAMVATERVVLFHDHPPQGAGNAEILDRGLALCRGLVALPHAEKRLALDDPVRVSLLARRFSDFQLAALDPGARLDWEPPDWIRQPGTQRLRADGSLEVWS